MEETSLFPGWKVGIVGLGKMGTAIARGMFSGGVIRKRDFFGCFRSEESRAAFELATRADVSAYTPSLPAVIESVDVVIMAVKPQQFQEVFSGVKPGRPKLWISVAAGIPIERIHELVGEDQRVVRAMPNTPLLLGAGATGLALGSQVTDEDRRFAETLFGSVGKVHVVEEEQIDLVTAVSGSGPAYFYLFAELLAREAVSQGLDPAVAMDLVAQTAYGAGRMLREMEMAPNDLISQVTSKGGTTEAALNALNHQNLGATVSAAVQAAVKRASELRAA